MPDDRPDDKGRAGVMRLTIRKKALLLILPILCLVSMAYTYDAIMTGREIVRGEIIKRAEAITTLATRTGELPILSGTTELMRTAAASLMSNPEVAAFSLFDREMNMLVHDGAPISGRAPRLSPEIPLFMSEEKDLFVFYAPVFTVRAGEDIDMFHEGERSRQVRENIGWVRVGFSKDAVNEAVGRVVSRGVVLAVVFIAGSSIVIFLLITFTTRPLMALLGAVKKVERGEFPRISDVQTTDEIRELAEAFNRMIVAIRSRESDLLASERRMRDLFARVEHGIFRLDEKGAIVEANSKFRDLFGGVEMFCDILAGEEDAAECFRRAVAGSPVHLEERAVGREGDELTILLSLYPEFDDNGNVRGYDGYIIDITEKKRLEERLLRSQKLESVGTLAGGMAHDFNNVLTAILGYSEMLREDMREGDPHYKPITVIHNAARHGADLAMKILAITRKEKMEQRSVDLNTLVKNSVEMLRSSMPKDIEIRTVLEEGIPAIMADPSQMQQVILNLAINARDAMADGSVLTIGVGRPEDEKAAAPAVSADSCGYLRLFVSDTGVGMSRQTQSRIFDPFFTTKEAGRGTGLGLYIVHSIVQNHGGHINLFSEQGKGTVFNVYLPNRQAPAPEQTAEAEARGGSATVLIIDDEAPVREMCRDLLTRLGYRIILAPDGISGVNTYKKMKDSVSLVILDMIMPSMNGTEVFRLLKAINPDVKIVLCSGFSGEGDGGIDELLRAGASGFVQKPFGRAEIAAAIRKALSAPCS